MMRHVHVSVEVTGPYCLHKTALDMWCSLVNMLFMPSLHGCTDAVQVPVTT
jgi:hypothetical protein